MQGKINFRLELKVLANFHNYLTYNFFINLLHIQPVSSHLSLLHASPHMTCMCKKMLANSTFLQWIHSISPVFSWTNRWRYLCIWYVCWKCLYFFSLKLFKTNSSSYYNNAFINLNNVGTEYRLCNWNRAIFHNISSVHTKELK